MCAGKVTVGVAVWMELVSGGELMTARVFRGTCLAGGRGRGQA